MSLDLFWLTEQQFARIEPHLPCDTRGKPRVDDRRVISGIVHVLKSGGRWADAPPNYGPKKTLYNRFVRWSAKGVWTSIFHALARAGVRRAHCRGRRSPSSVREARRHEPNHPTPLLRFGFSRA